MTTQPKYREGVHVGPLALRIMDTLLEIVAETGRRADVVQVSQHVWNGLLYETREAVTGHGWNGNIAGVPVELNRDLPPTWGRAMRGGAIVSAIVFE